MEMNDWVWVKKGNLMTRNFKKLRSEQYQEQEGIKPICKKKKHTDIKEKMRLKAELKAHFPDRVWGIPDERKHKKGPKI
jgi:hypothetical protein